jgi:hypothetical protein
MTDIEILQSQLRQQKENVRVWEEGLAREKATLSLMKEALTVEIAARADKEGLNDDGEN